jgi:tetrahydromethanopterin S-methyltransferase subunit G
MDENTFPQGIVDRESIARELQTESNRLSNGDKWVREIGFWLGIVFGLLVVWVLVAGFTIG